MSLTEALVMPIKNQDKTIVLFEVAQCDHLLDGLLAVAESTAVSHKMVRTVEAAEPAAEPLKTASVQAFEKVDTLPPLTPLLRHVPWLCWRCWLAVDNDVPEDVQTS